MEKFTSLTAVAAPMDAANVDTDQLIPKQFLKRVEREGYGQYLFFDWRYLDDGSPNPEFILNQKPYDQAKILVARENFGCGSSREHAPWALQDYGLKAIIAPSFADIFKNNCQKIGLLTIELPAAQVDGFIKKIQANPGYTVTVDLPGQTVTGQDGESATFEVDPHYKRLLTEGLDFISVTLEHESAIEEYEQKHRAPWQAGVDAPTDI